MGIRKLKPAMPGQRHKIIGAFDATAIDASEKSLVVGARKSGGRNNTGKMTIRNVGGGHKRKYRLINFERTKNGIPATVKSIERDPNRSSRIVLLYYADGVKSYIIAPNGLTVGQQVMSGDNAIPEVGSALLLAKVPVGMIVHNVELRPGQGGKLVRSAGAFAQLVARKDNYVVLRMPSGKARRILAVCKATIGSVGNSDHTLERSGKAGRIHWLGRRSRVRGVAMNPVDHPMGGGEGRASEGHPRSRMDLYSKGPKTRAPKKYSFKYIIERAKRKK